MTRDLFFGTRGPHDAPIVLIGESWGAEEAAQQKPFVGSSGTELNRILSDAGIDQRSVLFTNMVAEKPSGNETWRFFLPKAAKPERTDRLAPSSMVQSEIKRLYAQIAQFPRSLVIAAGNWPLWTLCSKGGVEMLRQSSNNAIPAEQQTWAPTGIGNWRGSMLYCEPKHELWPQRNALDRIPLLPIYHPAAIQRAWYTRAVTVHDLRARVNQAIRNDWRPLKSPELLSTPTFKEVCDVLRSFLSRAERGTLRLANDLETVRKRFISVNGFADSEAFAISIPFLQCDEEDGSFRSYWSPSEEGTIVGLLRQLYSHPNVALEGQNYIYDTQYIQDHYGVTPKLAFDSMIAQNTLFPGTPKALEYLSSLYCRYHWYWKEDQKDWDKVGDLKRLLDYNCLDCIRTFECCTTLRSLVKSMNMTWQYDFKLQVNDLCLRMMNRGIRVDAAKKERLKIELNEALNGFYSELEEIIPQEMVLPDHKTRWYKSDKQTKMLFYDIFNMRRVTHRKTGKPTTGKEALMQLEKWYPEFKGLFRRLDYAGSVENSAQVVSTTLDPDGRIRCSFNPAGTETHRLSSAANAFGRGTNLQNLTIGEEDE